MSKKQKFESLMRRADFEKGGGDKPDYWAGYTRGLRRAYHGESFGTDEEHEQWLAAVDRPGYEERGEGYLAGLAALDADGKPGTPSAEAVHAFLQQHGITGSQAARMLYLSDSRQVRKYTGGKSPRQLGLLHWFALHAHTVLTPEQIAEIEAAMDADLVGAE
ncbi:MAG: hypothetical protein DIZ78_09335 [endosymbiont of Escarpia spicata]|uniref:XRE family transcriptional regulator n=1 Tax=endosymbiont of Escarpia spicata TaxID=2200908 RepID=A0A370DN61_9GAMM|nr:MAG: hypothetical protein DIZ78_09335 [endosymbiont of Escarpia spicata]